MSFESNPPFTFSKLSFSQAFLFCTFTWHLLNQLKTQHSLLPTIQRSSTLQLQVTDKLCEAQFNWVTPSVQAARSAVMATLLPYLHGTLKAIDSNATEYQPYFLLSASITYITVRNTHSHPFCHLLPKTCLFVSSA